MVGVTVNKTKINSSTSSVMYGICIPCIYDHLSGCLFKLLSPVVDPTVMVMLSRELPFISISY